MDHVTAYQDAHGRVAGLDADRWRQHFVMPSYQAPAEPVVE